MGNNNSNSGEVAAVQGSNEVHVRRLSRHVIAQRDVPILTRDQTIIRANIYTPEAEGRYPVLMSFAPYGKDHFSSIYLGGAFSIPNHQYLIMWMLGGDFGSVSISDSTPWEGADPDYWCLHGFVVIHADTRGFANSDGAGQGALFGAGHEPEDYYDLIEWAAAQPWSSGKVGLIGTSYLAISQWYVAALRPPSLAAMCPWEGFSDPYRHTIFVGGANPPNFFSFFYGKAIRPKMNGVLIEDYAARVAETMENNNLTNDFWKSMVATVEHIQVPALVCGSWSDQCVHNPGVFESFERLGSEKKWLYTHGRSKWDVFYKESDLQKQFFDKFLKGEENGWEDIPTVRVEVRDTRQKYHAVRYETSWPLASTRYTTLSLSPEGLRSDHSVIQEQEAKFDAEQEIAYNPLSGEAVLRFTFEEETELTGYFMLRLWVTCEGHDDMDLIIAAHKLNTSGHRVLYSGVMGDITEGVTKGFMRVSHRVSLKPEKSTPYRPYYGHDSSEPLPGNGEFVCVDIPMHPSSTIFHAGETLELTVAGRNLSTFPPLVRAKQGNAGIHKIKCGGQYDSHLLVPVIPPSN